MSGDVGSYRCCKNPVAQLLGHVLHFATHGLQLIRLPHPSISPGACSDSSPCVGDAI